MSLKRTSSAAGLPDRADDDAPCCWLCLEEGPDDSGKPLCRDCSCRGTSGYAHLSCMVTYAERKGKEAYENDGGMFRHFFVTCPNCNQEYQGGVKADMITAQLEFVEREYKNDLELNLEALLDKFNHLINSLNPKDEIHVQKGEDICSKLLPMMEQMKKNSSMDRHKRLIAEVNFVVGDFFRQIGNNDYLEKAKKHLLQAKDLYEELGEDSKVEAQIMESVIRVVEANLRGTDAELDVNMEEGSAFWRERYNDDIKQQGESHLQTLNCGYLLVKALGREGNQIEAERLLSKLLTTSRQAHGVEHNVTKHFSTMLQNVKVRVVDFVTPQGEVLIYQALRYENDGEKIVVQGPLANYEERKLEEQKTVTVNRKDIFPHVGTPVVVHGLRQNSMSRLNGEIGFVRDYADDTTCLIHFEEEGLNPTEVRCENLRILFDLPEKEETEDSL